MESLRIANCSGFYGDRRSAPRELLEGGPIDVLTGDYLAELTMLILWRSRGRDPAKGYATSFLGQMEECLGLAVDKGVKVVANAGGLNPSGLAAELRALAGRLGLDVGVAHVEGDDLLPRLPELQAKGNLLRHLDTGRSLAAEGVQPVS
ncbi:MAG TPA: acyclic terpene utilization AtuA family protein, partial [Actinomycetota bacterium]|nr:acyclic terpene utilization AtuA family protein [Actinomycetota bacterium]